MEAGGISCPVGVWLEVSVWKQGGEFTSAFSRMAGRAAGVHSIVPGGVHPGGCSAYGRGFFGTTSLDRMVGILMVPHKGLALGSDGK